MADDAKSKRTGQNRRPSEDQPGGGQPSGPSPRKPIIGKGTVITLIAAIAVVVVTAWYAEEVRGFFALKPWDKGGPRAAVQRFVDAVRSGDAEAVAASSEAGNFVATVTDGVTVTVKTNDNPMAPPLQAAEALPASEEYAEPPDYRYGQQRVSLTYLSEAGGIVSYEVVRTKGGFRLRTVGHMVPR